MAVRTLRVTNIQIFPLAEAVGKTKAMVRVVLEDQLQLTGMRIIDSANGFFVSYPNDPTYKGGDYRSLFYPVTGELRDVIESAVLEKYYALLDEKASGSAYNDSGRSGCPE